MAPAGDTGCTPDYTHMAVDANAIYLKFSLISCPVPNAATFVVRKSSVLATGPMFVTALRGIGGIPVDNFDPGATVGYIASTPFVAGAGDYPTSQARLYRVLDPGGHPQRLPLRKPSATSLPLDFPWPVRHKGNVLESGSRDDFSGRMFIANAWSHSVPLRNGKIWLAGVVGLDNTGTRQRLFCATPTGPVLCEPPVYGPMTSTRDGITWLAVGNVDSATPTPLDSGVLFARSPSNDYDQRNYWIPALMVNGQGHMVIATSAAGTNEYINAVFLDGWRRTHRGYSAHPSSSLTQRPRITSTLSQAIPDGGVITRTSVLIPATT